MMLSLRGATFIPPTGALRISLSGTDTTALSTGSDRINASRGTTVTAWGRERFTYLIRAGSILAASPLMCPTFTFLRYVVLTV
jgi:hypothetical protein